jgi:hypothetical protein
MESAGSGRGVAMEQNKNSINGNEQSNVHMLNGSDRLIWDLFDLKDDFLRKGEGALNASRSGIDGSVDRRLTTEIITDFIRFDLSRGAVGWGTHSQTRFEKLSGIIGRIPNSHKIASYNRSITLHS